MGIKMSRHTCHDGYKRKIEQRITRENHHYKWMMESEILREVKVKFNFMVFDNLNFFLRPSWRIIYRKIPLNSLKTSFEFLEMIRVSIAARF